MPVASAPIRSAGSKCAIAEARNRSTAMRASDATAMRSCDATALQALSLASVATA